MQNTEQQPLEALLQQIAQEQGEGFTYDKSKIAHEADQGSFRISQLAIKVLIIMGGLLASATFLGFLAAAGLFDSAIGLTVTGVVFITGAEWLIRSRKESFTDSLGVSVHIAGFILLAIGVGQLTNHDSAVAGVLACAAMLVILFSGSSLCVFLSVLVLNGSLLTLITENKVYNLAHGLLALQAAILLYISLNEARLIASSPGFNANYSSIRTGVALSLLATLAIFVHQKILSARIDHLWLSGLLLIGLLLYLLHKILGDVGITNTKTKAVFYTCCTLILAPTILAPSVPGALLVLLCSFYIGHRTGFWLGLLALAYFVVIYYYDLNMTLLAKSGVLVASGLLFLGGFALLNKYLKSYAD